MSSLESEEEELKKAIALSLQEDTALASSVGSYKPSSMEQLLTPPATQPITNTSTTSQAFSLAGMNRKAMEAERRARNAARAPKRERSISPPELSRPTKSIKSGSGSSASTIQTKQDTNLSAGNVLPTSSQTLQRDTPPLTGPWIAYPQGVVKKTWAFGYERSPSDVKIEEVLESRTLTTAVLSAFQWDTEWVMSKVDMQRTKLIFVMQAKTEAEQTQYRSETADLRKSLQLCFPPMEGQVNCMHSKLMLLFHPHKLRIVVPSANLCPYDWGETGVMENSVFMIDLPRHADGNVSAVEDLTAFGKEIMYFVERMGLDRKARDGMLNFDYSGTSQLAFVHSVGGVSFGEDIKRTGHMGLNKAITELGLQTQNLQIDFAASSIGSLNDEFLNIIHRSAQGHGIESIPTPAKKTTNTPSTNTTNIKDVFRIYFPTLDTVKASNRGTDSGGTICLQRQWFTSPKFPQSCFRDYRSLRPGMLSHNKILYARGRRTGGGGGGGDDRAVAWVYVGSANLSESAWGKMTFDRQRKEAKMSCRNWECGVVIPVPADRLAGGEGGADKDGLPGMGVFDGILDLPFVYPAEGYDGRQPWYFMEE